MAQVYSSGIRSNIIHASVVPEVSDYDIQSLQQDISSNKVMDVTKRMPSETIHINIQDDLIDTLEEQQLENFFNVTNVQTKSEDLDTDEEVILPFSDPSTRFLQQRDRSNVILC